MSELSDMVKDVFEQYISDEKELDAFAHWAFGEDFLKLKQAIKFLENWNTLHGEEVRLKPEGVPSEDAPRMVALWKASLA